MKTALKCCILLLSVFTACRAFAEDALLESFRRVIEGETPANKMEAVINAGKLAAVPQHRGAAVELLSHVVADADTPEKDQDIWDRAMGELQDISDELSSLQRSAGVAAVKKQLGQQLTVLRFLIKADDADEKEKRKTLIRNNCSECVKLLATLAEHPNSRHADTVVAFNTLIDLISEDDANVARLRIACIAELRRLASACTPENRTVFLTTLVQRVIDEAPGSESDPQSRLYGPLLSLHAFLNSGHRRSIVRHLNRTLAAAPKSDDKAVDARIQAIRGIALITWKTTLQEETSRQFKRIVTDEREKKQVRLRAAKELERINRLRK